MLLFLGTATESSICFQMLLVTVALIQLYAHSHLYQKMHTDNMNANVVPDVHLYLHTLSRAFQYLEGAHFQSAIFAVTMFTSASDSRYGCCALWKKFPQLLLPPDQSYCALSLPNPCHFLKSWAVVQPQLTDAAPVPRHYHMCRCQAMYSCILLVFKEMGP